MKARYKYFGSTGLYLGLYLLGIIPYYATRWLVEAFHDLLAELFPTVFHSYNIITAPDEYLIQSARLETVTAVISILIITYFALRLDNKRFEHFIVGNEGLYTMPEGLAQYCREFLAIDVAISLAVPVLFSLPLAFVPEVWIERVAWIPTALNHTLVSAYGQARGTLTACLISLGARVILIPHTVSRWRAAWLCGSFD